MSVNRYRPHVFVLPEDDANRQIANGFLRTPTLDLRSIQVLPNAGGWVEVRDEFFNTHRAEMLKLPFRHMVLLVDFDRQPDRLQRLKEAIPEELTDRVFVIGAWSEPEDLRGATGENFEAIGLSLAQDCQDSSNHLWGHTLLQHNAGELARMMSVLRPILFPSV